VRIKIPPFREIALFHNIGIITIPKTAGKQGKQPDNGAKWP
jgi:hypothetical protein